MDAPAEDFHLQLEGWEAHVAGILRYVFDAEVEPADVARSNAPIAVGTLMAIRRSRGIRQPTEKSNAALSRKFRQPSRRAYDYPFQWNRDGGFSDAIIASTERAKVLHEDGHDPVFYIPFEDIYFDLLEKTNAATHSPLKGTASYWRVHAVGGAADDFMWAYETPDTPALAIARHGAFDPKKARIDADPAEDKRHTPHIPE